MSDCVFITDCEGPITKNDNAAELADAFLPNGASFFQKISLYDDYLAEIVHRPNYKAGDTLKLILPFFKAYGIDNRTMEKFSSQNIQIIPAADNVLRELSQKLPVYIVSTSYIHYISAVCNVIGFPMSHTFSTLINLDEYTLSPAENRIIKELHARILDLSDFEIPTDAKGPEDLTPEDRKTINILDEIFWEIMPGLEINSIIESTNPVGGEEKAAAVETIIRAQKVQLKDVIYFGDSITDIQAFRKIRGGGGAAISFNGNNWAVRESGFAITSTHALPILWIAEMFMTLGLEGLTDLTMSQVLPENTLAITKLSTRVRKSVRTEKIGSLG
jgi:energy-converting hydrogenase A subunit R